MDLFHGGRHGQESTTTSTQRQEKGHENPNAALHAQATRPTPTGPAIGSGVHDRPGPEESSGEDFQEGKVGACSVVCFRAGPYQSDVGGAKELLQGLQGVGPRVGFHGS